MGTLNYKIKHFQTVDSTNMVAHREISAGEMGHGLVVSADYQSSGHGQAGNHWESEMGKNLLFTLCVQPIFLQSKDQFLLSETVSLSICATLNELIPGFVIKWPNDIYYESKKVCGILIEQTLTSSRIVQSFIGIGINVNQATFRSNAPNPVSLLQITGKETDLQTLLNSFLHHFEHYYNLLEQHQFPSIHETYKNLLFRRLGIHPYQDAHGLFKAQITDVLQDGHLVLQDTAGHVRKYMFKEVEYIHL